MGEGLVVPAIAISVWKNFAWSSSSPVAAFISGGLNAVLFFMAFVV